MRIDSHAHIFTRDLPMASDSRYVVDYDADLPSYLHMLAKEGMGAGVLVQPSFLGTDNRYLLKALAAYPGRLRGIVVVPQSISESELQNHAQLGVVGVRLNLLGKPDPDFADPAFDNHLKLLSKLKWQVEIQAEARRLPRIVPGLLDHGLDVVVDHFGRPDENTGLDDPGFRFLLRSGASGRVWVKMSGWYRLAPGKAGELLASRAATRLLEAFGAGNLLYGSDWPHTQFETKVGQAQPIQLFATWVPSARDRAMILGATPKKLFRFDLSTVADQQSLGNVSRKGHLGQDG